MTMIVQPKIAVIGLGYVGLPLAVAFGSQYPTIGFDLDLRRLKELEQKHDRTGECSAGEIETAIQLIFTSKTVELRNANTYIVTVPTPITKEKKPDLSYLCSASETVAKAMDPGDVVIFESTVYPGATEEICVPVLEEYSGLAFNTKFFVGYSPERINPGDKCHRLVDVVKVTSGSTEQTSDYVDSLYRSIIKAGTYRAESIKVAEAAKVIENTQRDLNIALINELSKIFHKLGLDTHQVLSAAGSKWNFLDFKPGLVGGHCIGVDPYYLTHKAQSVGFSPDVILAGRKTNDSMGNYVVSRILEQMKSASLQFSGARVLVLGLAFKENCSDIRNTKVIDIITGLAAHSMEVDVYDPIVAPEEVAAAFGINLLETYEASEYEVLVLAVPHDVILDSLHDNFRERPALLFDVKGALPLEETDGRL